MSSDQCARRPSLQREAGHKKVNRPERRHGEETQEGEVGLALGKERELQRRRPARHRRNNCLQRADRKSQQRKPGELERSAIFQESEISSQRAKEIDRDDQSWN